MRFYVHGAGRAGREAWPSQPDSGAVFADHSAARPMLEKAAVLVRQCPAGEVAVVAHSLGAVPVALAVDRLPMTHLVLVEPALYDVARGDTAVEAHVGPMTEARALAASGDLFGFWTIVAPMMFGREASRDTWAEDADLARRFSSLDAPWGHGISATAFGGLPTLVVTGGWNDEYEAIALRLADAGAEHVRLPGARHRPQDVAGFEEVVVGFVGGHRA